MFTKTCANSLSEPFVTGFNSNWQKPLDQLNSGYFGFGPPKYPLSVSNGR
jgi:hypothetical protein